MWSIFTTSWIQSGRFFFSVLHGKIPAVSEKSPSSYPSNAKWSTFWVVKNICLCQVQPPWKRMHRFWKWSKLIAPAPKPDRLLTLVRKQNLSPTTLYICMLKIREVKHSCRSWYSEISNSFFSFYCLFSTSPLFWFNLSLLFFSLLLSTFFSAYSTIIFPFNPSIAPGFYCDSSFVASYPRRHLILRHRFSFTHSPFRLFATPPPHSARADQPGRALTWCTTTSWLMWTGPVWTCQAVVAACRGQNCPLTCRRTLTMTPSGPATVTGWVRCRVRAASLTRTKRTVLPRCIVLWCRACLPLIFGVSKETSVDFFCIYLFSTTCCFIFLNLLSYLFLDSLF